MPFIEAFHSLHEFHKPPMERVYHNNSACYLGREVFLSERKPGTGPHRLCDECSRLNGLLR